MSCHRAGKQGWALFLMPSFVSNFAWRDRAATIGFEHIPSELFTPPNIMKVWHKKESSNPKACESVESLKEGDIIIKPNSKTVTGKCRFEGVCNREHKKNIKKCQNGVGVSLIFLNFSPPQDFLGL